MKVLAEAPGPFGSPMRFVDYDDSMDGGPWEIQTFHRVNSEDVWDRLATAETYNLAVATWAALIARSKK